MSGQLILDENGFGRGTYADLSINIKLAVEPVEDYKSHSEGGKKMPTHTIKADNGSGGGLVEIGAVWSNVVEDPNSKLHGQTILTLRMDDPSFPRALVVTGWPTNTPGRYELRFKRDTEEKAAA